MNTSNPKEEKLGLCLSGGGFRASLFHIGALAALAEREMLHRVAVLSTVSGGSIIGAYYYLKVKRLLEGRVPGCPSPSAAAYKQLVKEIEVDFVAAVQKNIRLRLFSNALSNMKMANEDYSRSDRLSELLNAHFYNEAGGEENILLKDIHIQPVGAGKEVSARLYNAENEFKIPILVINATCLNTGHPWHFTGAYIGEPKPRRTFIEDVDTNFRFPILGFDGFCRTDGDNKPLPSEKKPLNDRQKMKLDSITLADAVAASAAVPGIFPPLALHNLYSAGDKEVVVELSDGGVFDNQGVDALYQHECSHLIISDASGQLEDQRIIGTKFFQVVQRSSDIMMDKIRSETLYRVHAGYEANAALAQLPNLPPGMGDVVVLNENKVAGYTLIHLRQDFPNSHENPNFPEPVNSPEGTVYRLSGIRTDLDAFSDTEAYALMYDGYQLLHNRLGDAFMQFAGKAWSYDEHWHFLKMRALLINNDSFRRVHQRIRIGAKQFFRAFHLSPARAWLITAPLLVGAFLGLWWILCFALYTPPQGTCSFGLCNPAGIVVFNNKITMGQVLWGLLGVALVSLSTIGALQEVLKKIAPLRLLRRYGMGQIIGVGLGVALTVFAVCIWIYRQIYDRLFLAEGKLK